MIHLSNCQQVYKEVKDGGFRKVFRKKIPAAWTHGFSYNFLSSHGTRESIKQNIVNYHSSQGEIFRNILLSSLWSFWIITQFPNFWKWLKSPAWHTKWNRNLWLSLIFMLFIVKTFIWRCLLCLLCVYFGRPHLGILNI